MPSYEKKESFEQKRKRLASVKVWVENFLDADNKNKNILERFEKNVELELNTEAIGKIDPNAEPINILVLDGGGTRGYAAISTFEALNENYLEKGQNLFKQFDLIAGTSIGGIYSLFISYYSSLGLDMAQVIEKGRDLMDTAVDNGMAKIKFRNLLCCNQLIEKESQFLETFKKAGFDIPMKNSHRIPTMVCIAAVKDSKERDEESLHQIKDREIEPLIGRTYEYPNANTMSKTVPLAASSSGMHLCEAMAATGAPPVLVDRVRAKVDGKMRIMADGGLFQNSPLALAIDEASRLYPGRPIGNILNLGYLDYEEPFIHRTLKTARLNNPDMYFQRIAANDIMKDFSPIESDIKTITEMEAKVKDYVVNTPRVRNTTIETLRRLFSSKPRSFSTSEKEDHNETADKIMSDLGKSFAFQRRQRMRDSVAFNHYRSHQKSFHFQPNSKLDLHTNTPEPQTIHSTEEEKQSSQSEHKIAKVSFEMVEEQKEAKTICFDDSCCKAQEARLVKMEMEQKALSAEIASLKKEFHSRIDIDGVGYKRSQSRENKRRLENYLKRQMSQSSDEYNTTVENRSSDFSSPNSMIKERKTRVFTAEHFTHVFESDESSTDEHEQFSEDFLGFTEEK